MHEEYNGMTNINKNTLTNQNMIDENRSKNMIDEHRSGCCDTTYNKNTCSKEQYEVLCECSGYDIGHKRVNNCENDSRNGYSHIWESSSCGGGYKKETCGKGYSGGKGRGKKNSTAIKNIIAHQILDSRGVPTVEVEVYLECGAKGVASVPSGASTGIYEAHELRDGDSKKYRGLGVSRALYNVNHIIRQYLRGVNALNQVDIDRMLIEIDGTENKSKLGANATLGVSLAVSKAAASALGVPLYQYIGGCNAKILPIPMLNCINGGKHADNKLSIQEFMIAPVGAKTFSHAIEQSSNVFHTLKNILKSENHITSVGDEGGFAPNFESDEMAIEYLVKAIEKAGYIPGTDFKIALDVASSEMYKEALSVGKEGMYMFFKTGKLFTKEQLIDYYSVLVDKYPIYSIEDALNENDYDGYSDITNRLGNKIQLVGDDLFVTNTRRIRQGIEYNAGNAVLIKPNQIGTLTETLDAIALAKSHNWNVVISHRSGETVDTTIADIAVATGAGQIKTGAPSRGERIAKYNRLLRIEHELDAAGIYGMCTKKYCR